MTQSFHGRPQTHIPRDGMHFFYLVVPEHFEPEESAEEDSVDHGLPDHQTAADGQKPHHNLEKRRKKGLDGTLERIRRVRKSRKRLKSMICAIRNLRFDLKCKVSWNTKSHQSGIP